MASYRTNTDPKAVGNNYSKKLSIFANKLHQYTNVYKNQLSVMKRINTSLSGKGLQIRQLKDPMTWQQSDAYFSGIERSDVLTTIESEVSMELRRTVQILKDQKESIEALQLEHKQLAAAGNALEIANVPAEIVSPLYSGNSRQKSMNFYVSGGYKLLDELKTVNDLCFMSAAMYFPRFPNDFEKYQVFVNKWDNLILSLDDYLMFCSFLINRN